MFRMLAAAVFVVATTAPAQVTPYTTTTPPAVNGDADKIVCKKVEKIGTRLGARKVCLTVSEWRERELNDREETNRIVSGAKVCKTVECG